MRGRDNEANNTNENNRVKNPNWQETSQLAIYEDDLGVEPGTTKNNTRLWPEWGLNSGAPH